MQPASVNCFIDFRIYKQVKCNNWLFQRVTGRCEIKKQVRYLNHIKEEWNCSIICIYSSSESDGYLILLSSYHIFPTRIQLWTILCCAMAVNTVFVQWLEYTSIWPLDIACATFTIGFDVFRRILKRYGKSHDESLMFGMIFLMLGASEPDSILHAFLYVHT